MSIASITKHFMDTVSLIKSREVDHVVPYYDRADVSQKGNKSLLLKAELTFTDRPDGWNGVIPHIVLEWSK